MGLIYKRHSGAPDGKQSHTTEPPKTLSSGHAEIMNAFVCAVQGMIPLARIVVSDQFSPEERSHLRERAKGNGIFELSNLLAAACTETARNRLVAESATAARNSKKEGERS